MSATPAPDVDVKAWKALALADAAAAKSSAGGNCELLFARYATGKDFSRYEAGIGAATPESVRDFLAALAAGGRVEYIVNE